MSRSRGRTKGRRYDEEPKLNMKKVFAVLVAFIVIIMFILVIKGAFNNKDNTSTNISVKKYFSAFKDGKWGVIDSDGNTVIDLVYQEMIIIPDEKEDVFLCTYDVDYATGGYKTKVLNSKNEEILTGYDKIEAIANKDEGSLWYEADVLKVQKDGKYGLVNFKGKEILPVEYDNIESILGIKNALKIKKDGKYGIANNEGKIVIKPQYLEIAQLGKDNKSGYIVEDDNQKYGIVDYSDNVILQCEYDKVNQVYGNDLYVVTKLEKQILVGKDGKEVLSSNQNYDEITSILKTKDAGVIVKKGKKYGVINLKGEKVIEFNYDELQEAKSGIFIFKKNGKYGIIDVDNNEKVSAKYTNITYQEASDMYIAEKENFESDIIDDTFNVKLSGMLLAFNNEEGYIKIKNQENVSYYNFKFEEKHDTEIFANHTLFLRKQNGKYGFVDKDGNVVVDYQYDDATDQNDYGFAGVKKDGKWGLIDANGKLVQEPIYNLDNYLLVNFIGRWHIGEDLNMNYYNQL